MQATGLLHDSRRIAKRGQSAHAFFGALCCCLPVVRERFAEPDDLFDVSRFFSGFGFFKTGDHHTTVEPGLTSR